MPRESKQSAASQTLFLFSGLSCFPTAELNYLDLTAYSSLLLPRTDWHGKIY